MADNTLLNAGTGGDSIRDKDRSGVKTQIMALDLNPAGAESLMAGVMPVNTATDNLATGNLTALNTTVPVATNGSGTDIIEISGTWVGTITFEGSNNNFTTVQAIVAVFLGGIATAAATAAANGFYSVVSAGFAKVQARMSAYTSGTAAITSNSSAAHRIIVPLQLNSNNNKVGIHDSLGNATNSAGTGFLKVSDEPKQIFYDSFDAAIDTTNMWTSTQGSSGVAAAVALGVLSMGTGVVANGYSKLISIPTFKPVIPGWLIFSDALAFPDGAAPVANSYLFWGSGTTPATPTVTTPVTDGYGFERYTDGKLRAVVYAGGVRTIIADLSAGTGSGVQPLDASYHRWIIQVRTDKTYFFIDSIASSGLVATTNFQSSQAQILPKLYLAIGGATPPASNVQILSSGAVVSDTGKNSTQLSDGTYPFRKVNIGKNGGLSIKGASVTGQTTGFAAAATGNTTGLDVSEAGNVSFVFKNTVAASAFGAGGIVFFEQSDDNGSWGKLQVKREETGLISDTHTLGANTASSEFQFNAALQGGQWVRVRVTAGVTTNGMTIVILPGGLAFVPYTGVIQQPITKGTQGTTGITAQDLKDAGRSSRTLILDSFAVAATTETLNTMSYSTDNGTATTGTSYTVTATKRFRLQYIMASLHTIAGNTTAVNVIVRIRINNGGSAIVSSPIQFVIPIQGVAAANQAGIAVSIPLPDGYEIVAGAGIGVTTICAGFVATTAAPKVDISITGYEY